MNNTTTIRRVNVEPNISEAIEREFSRVFGVRPNAVERLSYTVYFVQSTFNECFAHIENNKIVLKKND